jgi:hypothetical protein
LIKVNVSVPYPELEFAASRAGDPAESAPQYSGAPHAEGELSVVALLTDVELETAVTVSTEVVV